MLNGQKKISRGFTLVELLIALAITGILLAAATVALNASVMNYRENEDIFKAVNNGRQALFRMTTQIRSGMVSNVDVADQTKCEVDCADGTLITFRYDSAEEELYVDRAGVPYLLCDNVTAMTFKKDNSTPTGDVKSVQISMTVASGNVHRTLSAAAVVRKVLE